MKTIYETEHLIMFLDNNTDIFIESKSKEIQEQYEHTMTADQKLERFDEFLDYFYNFWKLIETTNDEKLYTMKFNLNLLMIEIPLSKYVKIKNILNSLKPILNKNLKETYFKVENNLTKYFLDLMFTFYTPIKPVHIIN